MPWAVCGFPSMSQDIREAGESAKGVHALVCNMGAIDFVDSMVLAGKQANRLGKPIVLDPVAAGGTQLRRCEYDGCHIPQRHSYKRRSEEYLDSLYQKRVQMCVVSATAEPLLAALADETIHRF